MQSTVVKHKKDGGQSGGVFDSYHILRVSLTETGSPIGWRHKAMRPERVNADEFIYQ